MPVKNPLRGTQLQLPGTEALTEPPAAPVEAAPVKVRDRRSTNRRGRPPSIAWQPTAKACELLDVSRWVLASARKAGDLKKGYHWKVKNPTAARLTYLWHVERLEQWQSSVLDS